MSYSLALDGVITAIRKCVGVMDPDVPFRTQWDSLKAVVALEDIPTPTNRLFDIQLVDGPSDGHGSGYCYDEWTAVCELRVLYTSEQGESRRQRMIAGDIPRLVHALADPYHYVPGVTHAIAVEERRPTPIILRRGQKELARIERVTFRLHFIDDLADVTYDN